MTIAKWTSIYEHNNIYFIMLQNLMEKVFAGVGSRSLNDPKTLQNLMTLKGCAITIKSWNYVSLIKSIHKVAFSFTPYPLFQWYPQSNEFLLNLIMKI